MVISTPISQRLNKVIIQRKRHLRTRMSGGVGALWLDSAWLPDSPLIKGLVVKLTKVPMG